MLRSVDSEIQNPETDFENLVGRIVIAFDPIMRLNITEKDFLAVTQEVHTIIRTAWRLKEEQVAPKQLRSQSYAQRRANKLFGGHCSACAHFDPDEPCSTLDERYPGCVNFLREVPTRGVKNEQQE